MAVVLRALLVLAAAVVLLAVPAAATLSKKNKMKLAQVNNVCRSTSYPDVCFKTAGKHVSHYRRVDPLSVLQMQVDAFSKRTDAARVRVAKRMKRANRRARHAMAMCFKFYQDVHDNLGACRRAIRHRDAVTIRATMSMAAQDMLNCDEQFRQAGGARNPLERHNRSLGKMAEVCRSLSNMIPII